MKEESKNSKTLTLDDLYFSNQDPVLKFHFAHAFENSPAITLTNESLKISSDRFKSKLAIDLLSSRKNRLAGRELSLDSSAEMMNIHDSELALHCPGYDALRQLKVQIDQCFAELKANCLALSNHIRSKNGRTSDQGALIWLNSLQKVLPTDAELKEPLLQGRYSIRKMLICQSAIEPAALMKRHNALLLNRFYWARDRFLRSIESCFVPSFGSTDYMLLVESFFDLVSSSDLWSGGPGFGVQLAKWASSLQLNDFLRWHSGQSRLLSAIEAKAQHVLDLCLNLQRVSLSQVDFESLGKIAMAEIKSFYQSQPLLTLISCGIIEIKKSKVNEGNMLVCLGIDTIAARFTHKSTGKYPFAGYLALAHLDSNSADIDEVDLESSEASDDSAPGKEPLKNVADKLGTAELLGLAPAELARELCQV